MSTHDSIITENKTANEMFAFIPHHISFQEVGECFQCHYFQLSSWLLEEPFCTAPLGLVRDKLPLWFGT